MTQMVRNIIIVLGMIGALAYVNLQIKGANALKENGETVLFELRPVDPRAFMMGDFMTLRYDDGVYPPKEIEIKRPTGNVVLKLDENKVAKFVRIDSGDNLGSGEIRLKFIKEFEGGVTYGGERFYFQEGTAEVYEQADYGVFKVSESGSALLIGLADKDFNILKSDNQ